MSVVGKLTEWVRGKVGRSVVVGEDSSLSSSFLLTPPAPSPLEELTTIKGELDAFGVAPGLSTAERVMVACAERDLWRKAALSRDIRHG